MSRICRRCCLVQKRCTELQIHENDVVFTVDHDKHGLFLCTRKGFGSYDGEIRVLRNHDQYKRWESRSCVSCRDFAPLFTGHVIDLVEDFLLNNGTMLHAGDRAVVTTICGEHEELKFGDSAVDVSRGWWHHLCAPSPAAFAEESVGGEASRTNAYLTLLYMESNRAFLMLRFPCLVFFSALTLYFLRCHPYHSTSHKKVCCLVTLEAGYQKETREKQVEKKRRQRMNAERDKSDRKLLKKWLRASRKRQGRRWMTSRSHKEQLGKV